MQSPFEAFVKASLLAIESRDPTTAGHSLRVAALTVGIAERADAATDGPFRELHFSRDHLQAIRYASLLHDVGIIGVRERVLTKARKLYAGEMMVIEARFKSVRNSLEAEHLRTQLEQLRSGAASDERLAEMEQAHEQAQAELDRLLQVVRRANEPAILDEETFRALIDAGERDYTDVDGSRQRLLSTTEVSALSIRRGSLSESERREIESHVTHTFHILSQVPWRGVYRCIPQIAYAHHEKLDGSGYPRKLKAAEIPIESRMMAIADIYDALVSWDRPYKKAVPTERALGILKDEASQGKLDQELLGLFIDAKIYETRVGA
jgi:response regulator RpfG family c-di-GMP phosphodiesterase